MSDPDIKHHGNSYYTTYGPVVWRFTNLHDHSDGITAEVTATFSNGTRYWAKLNLASTPSRRDFNKAIQLREPLVEHNGIVDELCYGIVERYRRGEPAEELVPEPPSPDAWFLDKWFPLHETSILYGDGGSCKSFLALALAIAGRTGFPVGRSERWRVAPLRAVLYLDWESNARTHKIRLGKLCRLHGAGEPAAKIYYRRMTRSITDSLDAIAADVAKYEVDLVIVDSLAAASGPEPEFAHAALTTFNTLAALDTTTRLVIAHVNKVTADQKTGTPRPFGSVFVRNMPRGGMYCDPGERVNPDEVTVTYTHTKYNDEAPQPPRALSFAFDADNIHITVGEPDMARATISSRVLDGLKGGACTAVDLAKDLGVNLETVRTTLKRFEKIGQVIKLQPGSKGRGRETLWGLQVRKWFTDNGSPETS